MTFKSLRSEYHRQVCEQIIRLTGSGEAAYHNFADGSNNSSRLIAAQIVQKMGFQIGTDPISGQTAGDRFEELTKESIRKTFKLLAHLRPGDFKYQTSSQISTFHQYAHLEDIEKAIKANKDLLSVFGSDYIINPDIVVGRSPVSDEEINRTTKIIDGKDRLSRLTALRKQNFHDGSQILHASISCKWTIRSDRSQNARTEALNLIRHRKGNTPHIVTVTAEPLPTRIASLALGTGDLDCVYHFALYELLEAVRAIKNEDQLDMLNTLINGERLKDISDLSFDLAV